MLRGVSIPGGSSEPACVVRADIRHGRAAGPACGRADHRGEEFATCLAADYPNPIRLSAEAKTYLFWRGGNYNPTFSTRQDGQSTWSPARNLVMVSGERPYVKYDTRNGDTLGATVALTEVGVCLVMVALTRT